MMWLTLYSDFQKVDPKAIQQDLDLLWMYNLQWHFLESKAKKQLKDQEKQAMVSIQRNRYGS